MHADNDAGPPNDSHWWGWRQNRYLLDSLRTPLWCRSCKFKCSYELPFNPDLNFCEVIDGHQMQTEWFKHVSFMPMQCDRCHDRHKYFRLNGCGCHCGYDMCDDCMDVVRDFQKSAEFIDGRAMRLDDENKIHAKENSANIKRMCPHNEIFVYRGEVADIHEEGVKCDLIKFEDDSGNERVGFFVGLVSEDANWPVVRCRRSSDLHMYDNVQADTFLESWQYVFPDLRKHRGDNSHAD